MPSDALHYSYLAEELDALLSDGKIEKISMPEKDEIVLGIRARGKNFSLLVSACPSAARCHITESKKENPTVAPSFLMHLRKHIGGAKIIGISAVPFERVLKIEMLTRNEMADEEHKTLIAEIMGKYSNIILVSKNGIISDCIKKVGADTSSKRQVLPSLRYEYPPEQEKIAPTSTELAIVELKNFTGGDLASYAIKKFKGLAPVSAQEAIFSAIGKLDSPPLSDETARLVASKLKSLYECNNLRPCIRKSDGYNADFYFRPYSLFDGEYVFFDSLNQAVDVYFKDKDKQNRFNEKSRHLFTLLKNAIVRTEKKLEGFLEKSESCKNSELDKLFGELLLANIYKIKQGMTSITVENWYDDNKPVTVALDKDKSPQANAQTYFKKYSKKKKTTEQLVPLIEQARAQIDYYDSVLLSFSLCKENSEIDDLTDELEKAGLVKKRQKKAAKIKRQPSQPICVQIDGFTVKIGKNNMQNDAVTRCAKSDDIWLHTKAIHGSHVVISANGKTVPDAVIKKAAELAARYSKAAQSQNVPVDYTLAKYVSKPSGSPPGKVIYTHQSTIFVNPSIAFI